jgi:hypothetical protein
MSKVDQKPGFFQTMGAIADKAAEKAASTVSNAVGAAANAAGNLASNVAEDFAKVGDNLSKGNLLGAAAELMDATSMGTSVANSLEALGVLPNDPFAKNLVSAAANFAVGSVNPLAMVAGFKDLNDASMALANRGKKPAPAHTPPTPAVAFERAQRLRPAGYASFSVNVQVHVGVKPGALKPGCGLPGWNNWINQNPPIMRPAVAAMQDMVNRAVENALKEAGVERTGEPCRNKAPEDRSISDILNDPTLMFEDMVAMVMSKIVRDQQREITEKLRTWEENAPPKEGQKASSKEAPASGGAAAGGSAAAGAKVGAAAGAAGASAAPAAGGGGGAAGGNPLMQIAQMFTGGADISSIIALTGPEAAGNFLQAASGLAPILAPLISGALMAVPPIGPLIAPFVPMLLPVVMNVAGQALSSAGGAIGDAIMPQRFEVAEMIFGVLGLGGDGGGGGAMEAAAESGPRTSRRNLDPDDRPARTRKGRTSRTRSEGDGRVREEQRTRRGSMSESKVGGGSGEPVKGKDGGMAGSYDTAESRQMQMEMIKQLMNKMSEMQQALSNVLNTMHQGAMNSIRNIK